MLLAALDLGTLFSNKDAWTGKAEFFAVEHAKDGFAFASEDRTIVNCLRHDTCTWHGLKVWEAKVYFDKGGEEETISRVELSLYNRGDAGLVTMDVPALKEEIATVTKKLAPSSKKANPEKTTLRNGGVQYRQRFDGADPSGELVWGLSAADANKSRTVEYLRLTLTPKGETKPKRGAAVKKPAGVAGKAKIKDNVTKSPNGDVFIDNVPMVDQGQKGYCAAAVSERGVNPQSVGGHMRLIIGYNDKKKEVLYTDTWGEGHELKRMPEDLAFAITHDAFFLKPR